MIVASETVFHRIPALLDEGRPLCLATVLESEGSAPQPAGASALFSTGGLAAGTVGGGIVEAAAARTAAQCLQDRFARLASLSLRAEPGDPEGAVCGGAVLLLCDPHVGEARPIFERAAGRSGERSPGIMLTTIRPLDGGRAVASRSWLPAREIAPAAPGPDASLAGALRSCLADRSPRLLREGSVLLFAEPVHPPARLVIAGAGHVGRAVAQLGRFLDFEVIVLDDRREFADPDRLPGADAVIAGDIAANLAALPASPDDYFVIVTRGHRLDAEALAAVLGREAAYVGMIGSRSKVAAMRRDFLASGRATAEQWAGIHAPIGLQIRSRTPAEIAISIAAELALARAERERGARP